MNNENNESDKNEFPIIKPAEISLSREETVTGDGSQRTAAARTHLSRPVGAALLLLIAAVIGVVFVLPQWVKAPSTSDAPETPGTTATAGSSGERRERPSVTTTTPAASPWSEAQLEKLRKQSQDLLADMLEAQDKLKEHHVEEWAGEKYQSVIETADRGDTAYQDRHFEQAIDLYRRALDGFTGLLERMDQVYDEAMARGGKALEEGDATAAADAFDRALLIRPQDQAALRGERRAKTLDQVNALIADGDDALAGERLAEAKQRYARALEIDPYADSAKQQLQEVNRRIRDREFNNAMSDGYTALERGRLEPAREAFARAAKLKPDAGEAREALALVGEKIKTARINDRLEAAQQAAAAEQWQAAIEHYRQALAVDNSLAGAQDGLRRARLRFNLDQRLQRAIGNPERLWDEEVRQEARNLLQEARRIQPAGPRLSRQIDDLEKLLQAAAMPVTVTLRSDNQTQVTVYKVGDMGRFDEKTLTLTPGRYVAVGKRPGYRDVRVEFTVRPGKTPAPVVVETTDKIGL